MDELEKIAEKNSAELLIKNDEIVRINLALQVLGDVEDERRINEVAKADQRQYEAEELQTILELLMEKNIAMANDLETLHLNQNHMYKFMRRRNSRRQ